MIKHYTFNYNLYEAEACFRVDTNQFTAEMAHESLDFFSWNYDEDGDPIDEMMKKYALEAIRVATFNRYNLQGVIRDFNNKEGFFKIDGTAGIELNSISEYEFNEDALDMEIHSEPITHN